MRTSEIMTPNPIVVNVDASLGECAGRMLKHGIRHLPLVDGAHLSTRVLTDVAVFRYGGLAGEEMNQWIPFHSGSVPTLAHEVSEDVQVIVNQEDEVAATLRKLVESEQDFALVENDVGKLVGIVTEHDGLRIAADALADSGLTTSKELTTPALIARLTDPAHDILAALQKQRIRHIAVVNEERVVVGVVTVGDLLADNVIHNKTATIKDVMRPRKPRTIGGNQPLAEAARRMLADHIGCLPVVDEAGHPRGILTRTDLIEGAVAALQESDAFPSA